MNAPYIDSPTNASSDGEEIKKDPNYPVVNPMPSDDLNQTVSHLVNKQPVEGTIETINPTDELHAGEQQFENLLYQEFPPKELVAKSGKVMINKGQKPSEAPPMTPISEKILLPSLKNKWVTRLILVIFLVLPLIIATRFTLAQSSNAPIFANLLGTLNLTPSDTATATAIYKSTATAIYKSTATQTTTPSSISQTTVRVSSDNVNLSTGPGTSFAVVRKLTSGEPLMLLGRVSDNSWIYVKTLDGQEGWIKAVTANLTGINLDAHPIEMQSPLTQLTVKTNNYKVNLRTGPGTNYPKVQKIPFNESLILLGRLTDNSWLYVKTVDGKEGWVNTTSVNLVGINLDFDYLPVATSPPTPTTTPVVLVGMIERWIDVDLSDQMLRAYDGPNLMATFLVSTGIELYPTEKGQYHIYAMMRNSDMHGIDYFLPNVPNTMYYSGDFSIHGTYWHHNFGTPMSHGCVNMDTTDAEWLYNWASVGTLVNIHR